jgi:heme-degrading monooxygenase HmoA
MIARIWRGATTAADADAYVDYLRRSGAPAPRDTPGNRGFSILHRRLGDTAEFLNLSLWESLDAVAGFAGEEIERAVFFPEDDRYLVERDATVSHYEADDLGTSPVADGEISRVWHGWATPANALVYEAFLRAEMLPSIHRIDGYHGVLLLRREAGAEVEYVTITRWESLDAIRAFAGDDYEHAVVLPEARAVLAHFDERSAHYATFV